MRTRPFRIPSLRRAGILAAAITASAGLLGGGVASAAQGDAPAVASSGHHHAPVTDHQIPNLTKVKDQIKAYYGDHEVDGVHRASAHSNYARQVERIEHRARHYLSFRHHGHHGRGAKPALVFDVDDTTLLSYGYEVTEDFGYDPETNAAWVKEEKMPAVFGMTDLVNWASDAGYTVFFITGRPEGQRDATVGNLAKVGYEVPAGDHRLYLKNSDNPPAYLDCGTECTTIEYKSQTRDHIESLGYDIVADFGDQASDLKGGDAGRRYKMPNPMYFLP